MVLRVQILGANASPAMGDYNASSTFSSNEDHNACGELTTLSTLTEVQPCIYNNLETGSKDFAAGGKEVYVREEPQRDLNDGEDSDSDSYDPIVISKKYIKSIKQLH